MKKLFDILPSDFFKPLTSKYRMIYADCILLLFNSFKPEISYGVNREIVVKTFVDYFDADDREISFDDENYTSDAREKANGVILILKKCGWIDYEEEINHQINIVLFEYTIPIIEGMNRIIKEEETEYQGIISQIHASLQSEDLYAKPYEHIIMSIEKDAERLISELKKLNASIKRHMDAQTNQMDAAQILDHFFEYHQNIGSKAYLRMKTSDNISYFRTSIIDKIDDMLADADIMDRAMKGYMEVEQQEDSSIAYDAVVEILLDVKASFYRLDEIIAEIDTKHARYMRNAVMRARFLLSIGNNTEGKIAQILGDLTKKLNDSEGCDLNKEVDADFNNMFALFPQNYISPESLKTIPITRRNGVIDSLSEQVKMSQDERLLYKEVLRHKNRNRFSRKNINEYVDKLLADKDKIGVDKIPVASKRDLIRIIYISIYAGNKSNNYRIIRTNRRTQIGTYDIPYFEIERT